MTQLCELEERDWYELLRASVLEKERNAKQPTVHPNRFDLKTLHTQEQFKILVAAVGTLAFQLDIFKAFFPLLQPNVSEASLPLTSHPMRHSRDPQAEAHLKTSAGNQAPDSIFEPHLDTFVTNTANGKPSHEVFGRTPIRGSAAQSLPPQDSDEWKAGFTWKGVFFRLLESQDLENLKNMLLNMTKIMEALEGHEDLLRGSASSGTPRVIPALHVLIDFGTFGLFATPVVYNSTQSNIPLPFSAEKQTDFRVVRGMAVLFSTSLGISRAHDFAALLASDRTPSAEALASEQ